MAKLGFLLLIDRRISWPPCVFGEQALLLVIKSNPAGMPFFQKPFNGSKIVPICLF